MEPGRLFLTYSYDKRRYKDFEINIKEKVKDIVEYKAGYAYILTESGRVFLLITSYGQYPALSPLEPIELIKDHV